LDAEPRYALETLDDVLKAMGCVGGLRPDRAWAWRCPSLRRGHTSYFVYVPDRGCAWIRQDHVVAAALRLEKDPTEAVRLLKERGGEVLDP
jgi:hypothetical protein